MINWLDDWCCFKMLFIFIEGASYSSCQFFIRVFLFFDFFFRLKSKRGSKCNLKGKKDFHFNLQHEIRQPNWFQFTFNFFNKTVTEISKKMVIRETNKFHIYFKHFNSIPFILFLFFLFFCLLSFRWIYDIYYKRPIRIKSMLASIYKVGIYYDFTVRYSIKKTPKCFGVRRHQSVFGVFFQLSNNVIFQFYIYFLLLLFFIFTFNYFTYFNFSI